MRKIFKLQLVLFFACVISFGAFHNASASIIDTFEVLSGRVEFENAVSGDSFFVDIAGLEIVTRRNGAVLPGSSLAIQTELISMNLTGIGGIGGPYDGMPLNSSSLSLGHGTPFIGLSSRGSATGDEFFVEDSFSDVFLELTFASPGGGLGGGPGPGGGVLPFEAKLVLGTLDLKHVSSTVPSAVPEPGSIFLFGSGLMLLAGIRTSKEG